jgi:hypothetical protein
METQGFHQECVRPIQPQGSNGVSSVMFVWSANKHVRQHLHIYCCFPSILVYVWSLLLSFEIAYWRIAVMNNPTNHEFDHNLTIIGESKLVLILNMEFHRSSVLTLLVLGKSSMFMYIDLIFL